MGIRRIERQIRERQRRLQLDCRQYEFIIRNLRYKGSIDEDSFGRIGTVVSKEATAVVLVDLLIVDGRSNYDAVGRRKGERDPCRAFIGGIRILLRDLARQRIDAIDITAILLVPEARAKSQLAIHDRTARRRPNRVARVTPLGEGQAGLSE